VSLARRFAAGSTWMVVGTGADNLIQFLIFAVLARLLSVRDLGIVAFAMLFIDLSRILVTGGLPQTLVQRKDWSDYIASVCFTYNALMALAVALVFASIGGPLMEREYGHGSGLVGASLGLIFFLEAVKNVHAAKLRRELRYRSLALRGSVAGLLAGIVAVGLALAGAGVWALVFQRLSYQGVTTVLTWNAARWRPRLVVDRAVLRELMPFAVKVTITRGLEILNLRLPDLIVGFVLGPIGVAFYRVGTRALDALRRIIILPFQDASFAALSRLRSDAAIISAYVRVSRAAATATFPIFVGASAIGSEVTILLFGGKYAASGGIFAILALAGVPNTLILFAGSAFMASGRPRVGTVINVALALLNLLAIVPLAFYRGSLGAAVGSTLAICSTLPLVVLLLKLHLGLRVRDLVRALMPPALISIAMAAFLWGIKTFGLPHMHKLPEVAILVGLGAIFYAAVFAIWGRAHLRELIADLLPILPAVVARRLPFGSR
jgi:O-antigen/teichoic acid export membrane protein